MTQLNSILTQTLSPKKFWIYTDGSAVTAGERLGSYAAVIFPPEPDAPVHVMGCANWTTIDRMELLAINESMRYVREVALRGMVLEDTQVQIICDRQTMVRSATGEAERASNLDLWAAFDILSKRLGVSMEYWSRNDDPAQAQADAICMVLRDKLADFIASLKKTEAYQNIQLDRKNGKAFYKTQAKEEIALPISQ